MTGVQTCALPILGIPTVRDRVVQQACPIVIEPLVEANVLPCACGYRPTRSAGQAVLAVKETLVRSGGGVAADSEGFFDTVDHEILRGLVRRRISDRRVLTLIDQWLRAGVLIDGQRHATRGGVPQGGVGSPLRANMYLHTLDRWWSDRHTGTGQRYRSCDDVVVVCRRRAAAQQVRELVAGFLGRLTRTLHPRKTHVVDLGCDGVDFLGFHVHKRPSRRTGRLVPYAWPSQKAMQTVREKIRQQTERTRLRVDLGEVGGVLNRIIKGWRADFVLGHATTQLADLDRDVWRRLWRFLRTRQGARVGWYRRRVRSGSDGAAWPTIRTSISFGDRVCPIRRMSSFWNWRSRPIVTPSSRTTCAISSPRRGSNRRC